jgi:hypothetical protein
LFYIDSICERSKVDLFYLIDETNVHENGLCVNSSLNSIKVAPGELSNQNLCVNNRVDSIKVVPDDLCVIDMGHDIILDNECLVLNSCNYGLNDNHSFTNVTSECFDNNYGHNTIISDHSTGSDFQFGGFSNHCFANNDRQINHKFDIEVDNTDLLIDTFDDCLTEIVVIDDCVHSHVF